MAIRIWVWNVWAYFEVPIGPCEYAEFGLHPLLPSRRTAFVVRATLSETETVCTQARCRLTEKNQRHPGEGNNAHTPSVEWRPKQHH